MPSPLYVATLVERCCRNQHIKQLHAQLLVTGLFASDDFLLNKLLRRCGHLGNITYARQLFDGIPQPNVFLWTALVHGHVENQLYREALILYRSMLTNCVTPLSYTISSVLKASLGLSELQYGESIHGQVLKLGLDSDLISSNTILDFYSKSKRFDRASKLFGGMLLKDVVSWNVMIRCFCDSGDMGRARILFDEMPERNVVSWTTMICGYIKQRNMNAADCLFGQMDDRDAASWNVLIHGYVDSGDLRSARDFFDRMPNPEVGTWNLLIDAYCKVGDLEAARHLFDRMPERNVASWSMMINGYAKSGNVGSARSLFDEMPVRNLISWTAMMNGYIKNGEPYKVFMLFNKLQQSGLEPDETCLLSAISACAQLGILDTGEKLVNNYIGSRAYSNLQLVTCLIDMYAKSGCVERAFQVFRKAREKDLVCYSAMITAFAHHGMAQEAIHLFQEMLKEDIHPDEVIFLGILTACSHAGLVDEGRNYFDSMTKDYGCFPSVAHYSCMVDLFGRAGCFEEACQLIQSMPMQPHAGIWGSLLSACRLHGKIDLAEIAAKLLFEMEPHNSGNYILLSNLYAASSKWSNVSKIRSKIRECGVRKTPGCSWIEVNSFVHQFMMADKLHPESDSIYLMLDLLLQEMATLDMHLTRAYKISVAC